MAGVGKSSGPPDIIFGPGSHGVNRQVPAHMLGPDELYDSSNVWFLDGALQPRPGIQRLSTVLPYVEPTFTGRPMAIFWLVTQNGNPALVVSTNQYQYAKLTPSIITDPWLNITQGATVVLTGTDANPIRMTQLSVGGLPTVFITNGVDHLKAASDVSSGFVDMDTGGVLPKFTDITTVANRIVGIYEPYGIRWSDIFNANVATTGWPSLNFRNLSDTPDPVVAVRNLGTQGIVVYKLFSLWAGYAQSGSPANAFRFDYKGQFESPASPNAIVDTGGVHYYLGRTGRIGRFDGVTHQWIADGVWPVIQADMDPARPDLVHGVYNSRANAIAFYYKRIADSGHIVKGMVIITLPRPQVQIIHYGLFPGVSQKSITCGTLADAGSGGVYSVVCNGDSGTEGVNILATGVSDLGTAFNCSAHTGMQTTRRISRIEIEPFLERGSSYGTVTLNPVTSYVLSLPGGTVGNSETITLSDTTLIHDIHGFECSGRFVGLKISCTSADVVKYKGAAVYGHQMEQL